MISLDPIEYILLEGCVEVILSRFYMTCFLLVSGQFL